jgi:RNA polymerase sigma-70 factor, ECF subfamily
VSERWSTPGTREDTYSDDVRAALTNLKARDREVLYLVLWDDLSHSQAAEVLGCSTNSVAVRLHRAYLRLGTHLDATMQAPVFPADGLASRKET